MKNILIGPITFLMLVSVASAQQSPKQIWQGSEMDAVFIGKLSDAIANRLRAEFAKTDKAVRDAHAKAHGCVKATLTVSEGLQGRDLIKACLRKVERLTRPGFASPTARAIRPPMIGWQVRVVWRSNYSASRGPSSWTTRNGHKISR